MLPLPCPETGISTLGFYSLPGHPFVALFFFPLVLFRLDPFLSHHVRLLDVASGAFFSHTVICVK